MNSRPIAVLLLLTVIIVGVVSCPPVGASRPASVGVGGSPAHGPAGSRPPVLVVVNQSSAASVEIGDYYAKKRQIPAKFVCRLRCTTNEIASPEDYEKIRAAIRSYLQKNGLKDKVDYIVLTKGLPVKIQGKDMNFSLDSLLTVMWADSISSRFDNPYFRSTGHFRYADQGFYLVTRLDGYTVGEVKGLVDRSLAAKPRSGLFLFDLDPSRDRNPAFKWVNDSQREAIRLLAARKLVCRGVEEGYPGGEKGLMGYYTWGSNHPKFDSKKYVGNTYYPGAIAETVVSTSGRTFNPTKEGQSLVADLIQSGLTGVKGYAYEPYATAVARADILFGRYTSGFNLAESFYAASPYLHWMDVVVGDPLCAPYAASSKKK